MKLPFWGQNMNRAPVGVELIEQADDSFGSLSQAIERTLKNEGDCFDLNLLTMTGKQVAMSLERRRLVDIVEDEQKLFVVKRRQPNRVVRALTMGLYD